MNMILVLVMARSLLQRLRKNVTAYGAQRCYRIINKCTVSVEKILIETAVCHFIIKLIKPIQILLLLPELSQKFLSVLARLALACYVLKKRGAQFSIRNAVKKARTHPRHRTFEQPLENGLVIQQLQVVSPGSSRKRATRKPVIKKPAPEHKANIASYRISLRHYYFSMYAESLILTAASHLCGNDE